MRRALCLATVVAITSAVAVVATPALAQDELATSFEELIEVSEVLLDVVATDAEGEVVTGLGAEDFVVEEDGQPVEITSVSYYTTRYGDDVPEEVAQVPWSRYFIFFFDDQTRFQHYGTRLVVQQLKAGQHCARWVEEEMLPSDWVAVARHDGKLKIYQDFSQDREALKDAIRRAASGGKPQTFSSSRQRAQEPARLSVLRRLEPRAERRGRETVYESLGRLAEATSHLVGRKNLMLFSIGFGDIDTGSYRSEPDPELYPQLETLLNDHNVAVYPVDLTPPGRQPRHREFLDQLASDTGGYYDEDFVGVLRLMKDIAEDNYGYYLISYQSPRPAGEIGYQRLEVKARDPEIRVRARRGYRYGL